MGFLGDADGWEGKKVSFPKICHICYSYTLPKEDQKIYKSRDAPVRFIFYRKSETFVISCLFTGNQQLLLYHFFKVAFSGGGGSI